MRVSIIRKIDFWVGVPLCAFLSIFNYFVKLFKKSDNKAEPKRILFIELSEMGSAILAHSALMQTIKLHPDAKIYFLIFSKNQESAKLLDLIAPENVLVIDESSFLAFTITTIKVLYHLRSIKLDTVIDLELFSRCTALIAYLSGANRLIGFHRSTNEGLYRGNFLSHPVPYNPHVHIALNFLALVEALKSKQPEIPLVKADLSNQIIPLPQIILRADEQKQAISLLEGIQSGLSSKNLLIFNPDPGDALPLRGWPLDRFIEVARALLIDDANARIVIVGISSSKPIAEFFSSHLGREKCIDLTGRTSSLRSLLAIFSLGKLLLTNDSGPAHIASLTQIPIIVLFGPETPALYSPLSDKVINLYANFSCSPCLSALNHRKSNCNDNKCLQAIPSEVVIKHARHVLSNKSKVENGLLSILTREDFQWVGN